MGMHMLASPDILHRCAYGSSVFVYVPALFHWHYRHLVPYRDKPARGDSPHSAVFNKAHHIAGLGGLCERDTVVFIIYMYGSDRFHSLLHSWTQSGSSPTAM